MPGRILTWRVPFFMPTLHGNLTAGQEGLHAFGQGPAIGHPSTWELHSITRCQGLCHQGRRFERHRACRQETDV